MRLTPAYDRPLPTHFVDDSGTRFQSVDQVAYTSQDILDAERRLLALSKANTGPKLTTGVVRRHTTRQIQGTRLDRDQAAADTRLALSGRSLDLLVGPAGAGKTTALRALHRAWTVTHGKRSVIGLAPSAAAAGVLGASLGIHAENTAKFLYEHARGRWNLQPGQLILLDEASLAGTLALDRIAAAAAEAGAKLVLIGDWAQLSAVETGGAFGTLVRDRPDTPTLTAVRRFVHDWEKHASLGLRQGTVAVLNDYEDHQRIDDGELASMLDAAYTGWQADRAAGLATLMVAGNGDMVADLNRRARTDLVAAGTVETRGVALHDGTFAGVGDLIVTRRNDRRLSLGSSWVKNGDRWYVSRRSDDGSLTARRLGAGDQLQGRGLILPADYVRAEVELGYASTVHRAQGASVDTCHALVDPDTASRELFCVAMTRGKQCNTAYVIQPDPHELEAHLDQPEAKTRIEQLTRVLARSDADLSAMEARAAEADKYASLATLLDEYDVLVRDAQAPHWEALLDVAPFPEGVADDIFTSPAYERLESALARHEHSGHSVTEALTGLASRLTRATDDSDPAADLARLLDRATRELTPTTKIKARLAGLIALPTSILTDDMRTALTSRQQLIGAAATTLPTDAQTAKPAWLRPLGTMPGATRQRQQWLQCLATIALYRYRHEITGRRPLGTSHDIRTADQALEHRAAQAALTRARRLAETAQTHETPRYSQTADPHLRSL